MGGYHLEGSCPVCSRRLRSDHLTAHIRIHHPMVDNEEPYTVYVVLDVDTDEPLVRGITQNIALAKKRIYTKIPSQLCKIEVVGTARTYRDAVAIRGGGAGPVAGRKSRQSAGFTRRDGPVEVRFD